MYAYELILHLCIFILVEAIFSIIILAKGYDIAFHEMRCLLEKMMFSCDLANN
jgi:hypothetical protein